MANTTNPSITKTRKLVVVGDGMAGKTCLLYSYIYKTFDTTHTPTIFDTYAADIEINGKKVSLFNIVDFMLFFNGLNRFIFLLIDKFSSV